MNFEQAVIGVTERIMGNVVVVYGSEVYLIDRLLDIIQEEMTPQSLKSFNYSSFDAKVTSFDEIYDSCETLPMGGGRRVVVVDHADLSREGISKGKDLYDPLQDYIPTIGDHVTLYLVSRSDRFFKGKFQKAVAPFMTEVSLPKLDGGKLERFVMKKVRRERRSIDPGVVRGLIQQTGYLEKESAKTLYDVENELDKLINETNGAITMDAVSEVMPEKIDANIFRFLDDISKRDASATMKRLKGFERAHVDMHMVFYMVARRIRGLIQIKALETQRVPKAQGMKQTGISAFEYQKLQAQHRAFKQSELFDLYKRIFHIESTMKTQRMDMGLQLEMLVLDLKAKK